MDSAVLRPTDNSVPVFPEVYVRFLDPPSVEENSQQDAEIRIIIDTQSSSFGSSETALRLNEEINTAKEKEQVKVITDQLAKERGQIALLKEMETAKQKFEREAAERENFLRARQYSKDIETMQATRIPVLTQEIRHQNLGDCKPKPYMHIVQRENITTELDAFIKAEKAALKQKQMIDEKSMQNVIRNNEADERYVTAMKKKRLEQEYVNTMKKLEIVRRGYRQELIQGLSKPNQDNPAMCSPVDKLMRYTKQVEMDAAVEKILKVGKEHAIDDLEESLTTESSNKSSILDTAYIETSPVLDTLPKTAAAPLTSRTTVPCRRKHVGVQVDDLPLSKSVQVDLQSVSGTFGEILPSIITDAEKQGTLSRKNVSVQTDSILPFGVDTVDQTRSLSLVDSPQRGSFESDLDARESALSDQSSDSSKPFSCSTSYNSMPSRYGIPLLPQLLTPPPAKENSHASSTKEVSTAATQKQSAFRYFPPISSPVIPCSSLGAHLKKLVPRYSSGKDVRAKDEISLSNLRTAQVQAIPLSEPIRDRPKEKLTLVSLPHEVDITDLLQSKKDTRPMTSSDIQTLVKQGMALNVLSDAPVQTTSDSAVHGNSYDDVLNLDPMSLTQSQFDIRREHLSDISAVANLSNVELTTLDEFDPLSSKNQQRMASTANVSTDESIPSMETSQERLDAIHQSVLNQMKNLFPTLQNGSYEFDTPSGESASSGETLLDYLGYLGGYIPELSTIQEVDSALTNSLGLSTESASRIGPDDDVSHSSMSKQLSKKSKVEPLISLVDAFSDVSHLLESVTLVSPSSPESDLTSSTPTTAQKLGVHSTNVATTSESSSTISLTTADSLQFIPSPSLSSKLVSSAASSSNVEVTSSEITPYKPGPSSSEGDTCGHISLSSASSASVSTLQPKDGATAVEIIALNKPTSLHSRVERTLRETLLSDRVKSLLERETAKDIKTPARIHESSKDSSVSSFKTLGRESLESLAESTSQPQSVLTSTRINKAGTFPLVEMSPICPTAALPSGVNSVESIFFSRHPVDITPEPEMNEVVESSAGTFQTLCRAEQTLSTPENRQTGSTESSCDSFKTLPESEQIITSDAKQDVNILPQGSEEQQNQPSCSTQPSLSSATGSDDQLSQMFTQSRIEFQSTPIKGMAQAVQEDEKLSSEATSSKSSMSSKEMPRTIPEEDTVSDSQHYDPIETSILRLRESAHAAYEEEKAIMLSFEQHEMSAMNVEGHVSFLSTVTEHQPCTPEIPKLESKGCTTSGKKSSSKKSAASYKQRTKRLWNNLAEVKKRKELEERKIAAALNRERIKQYQMKLLQQRKTPKK